MESVVIVVMSLTSS